MVAGLKINEKLKIDAFSATEKYKDESWMNIWLKLFYSLFLFYILWILFINIYEKTKR
jgi:hypothetical protein